LSNTFKEGDRVVYTGSGPFIGMDARGTVQKTFASGRMAQVLFDKDNEEPYNIIVDNLKPEAQRFRVGQLVRCLEDNDPGYQFTAGEVYEVSEVDDRLDRISVLADDSGDDNGWSAKFFEPAVVVGSRVKFRPSHWDRVAFKSATVREIGEWSPGPRELLVEVDAPFEGHSNNGNLDSERAWWTDETDLDLITAEPEPTAPATKAREAIVCVLDGVTNQPLPAVRPYVHLNRWSAIGESERLAVNNPGKNFVVYEAVSVAYAPPPPKPVALSVAL
jgi:hypothetical protein